MNADTPIIACLYQEIGRILVPRRGNLSAWIII
jgi:hypothetical protein